MSTPCVVHAFPTAGALLAHAEGALLQREAENNLPLGILGCIVRGELVPGPEALYLAVETPGSDEVVAAVRACSDRIVLSRAHDAAIGALASQLRHAGVMLSGVSAVNETATAFAERWSELTGLRSSVAMRQRIYQAREVIAPPAPPAPPAGFARLATMEDVPFVAESIIGFDREASVAGRAPIVSEAMAAERTASGKVWVWDDGGPVAMAARARRTKNGECVNLVYTPAASRRRGYATALVAALTGALLAEGHGFVCLFTDLKNPTSNAIYQRIGYAPVADSMVVSFVTPAS